MSEHFFTFNGQAMPGGDRLVAVPGLVAGDKIISVVAVSGAVGDYTGSFLPYCPGATLIIQDTVNLSGITFLLRVQRAD